MFFFKNELFFFKKSFHCSHFLPRSIHATRPATFIQPITTYVFKILVCVCVCVFFFFLCFSDCCCCWFLQNSTNLQKSYAPHNFILSKDFKNNYTARSPIEEWTPEDTENYNNNNSDAAAKK
jgi:hypothetical protein